MKSSKIHMIEKLSIRKISIFSMLACLYLYSLNSHATEQRVSYNEDNIQNWLIRGMFLDIKPLRVESNISSIGGEIDTPEKRTFGLDTSYFFSKAFSLEFQGGVFSRNYRIKNSEIGSFKVGTIESNSISLTAQYHIYTDSNLLPYLGVGINHAWTRKVKPADGIPQFNVDDVNSFILNGGIDYKISESWLLSTSLKYIMSPEYNFSGYGFNANIKMNTLITGVGIAYRF